MNQDLIGETLANARRHLLSLRNEDGHWTGELSTSALSTATAIVALGSVDEKRYAFQIKAACLWLCENQNSDGGWGDTVRSYSNISTTLLCWSALKRFGWEGANVSVRRAGFWISDYVGSLSPALIAETVKARYGKDRTFSVPILMLCAICGTLGRDGWRWVLPLPFELAAFPRRWFAAMRLPVVSYALPALIAIGYAAFRNGSPVFRLLTGWWKQPVWPRVSRLLSEIQPSSGGFLEAAPLTCFVTMALVSAGEKEHPVVKKAVEFLLDTVREDGSWPIDTNLATWATTLSVKALGAENGTAAFDTSSEVRQWLLGQQYREVHPFTDAPPGGWAWTDLPGGVPDADDTPGALLALKRLPLNEDGAETLVAAEKAVVWLLNLQNRDGGIPTFCRGWGALPFDRSSPDLTAHTLRAWHSWEAEMPEEIRDRIVEAKAKAIGYLREQQRTEGSWVPLWFGNQDRLNDEENPTYGTANVLFALNPVEDPEMVKAGREWLLENQNPDGGWGSGRGITPSSIEETALAVSALAQGNPDDLQTVDALVRGAEWISKSTKNGSNFEPSPIGFYFARLWYYEQIYPVVWTVESLSNLQKVTAH